MACANALRLCNSRRPQKLLALLLLTFASWAGQAQPAAFSVYFPTGVCTLSAAAQKTLDSLVYSGAIHPRQRLTITGYADEPGTTALNNSLSQRRAEAVAAYLTRDGFLRKEDVATVSGRGYQAAEAGRGDNPRYRRADVMVRDVPREVAASPPVSAPPRTPAKAPVVRAPVLRLDTVKANSTLVLENVLFENNSDIVLPSSVPQLEGLLAAMQENLTVRIRLEGHVCCGGDPSHGQLISDIRARAVYDYLVRNGVERSRLSYQGFGFARPLAYPEQSEDDRRRNRRVEVRVLSK